MEKIKFLDLTADNAFDFCTVLDAVGLESIVNVVSKDEIIALQKSGKDAKSIGLILVMKVFSVIVKKMSSAREPIYSFFAGCCVWDNSGKPVTVDDLRKLKLSAFLKLMKDFVKNDAMMNVIEEVPMVFNNAAVEETPAQQE